MARLSRYELEDKIKRLERENRDLDRERDGAVRELRYAGYDYLPVEWINSDGAPIFLWQKTKETIELEKLEEKSREADLRAAVEEAYVSGRRSTITAIIEALGIKGYSASKPLYSFFGDSRQTESDELAAAHADKFWADIQTALRVRAERRQSESDDATEAKIAGLFTPKEKPKSTFADVGLMSGGLSATYASNLDATRLAEQVADLTKRMDAQEKGAE